MSSRPNASDADATFHSIAAIVRMGGVIALVVAIALAVASLTPPAAVDANAAATEFSARRAIDTTAAILRGPRPTGSLENDATRERLVAKLRELGLDVDVQEATACATALDWLRCARAHNVVAKLHGAHGDQAVALFAHYDSVPNALGAGDDGAGVATLLETARALRAGAPLRNDVLFVFDDAEEDGLLGAVAFAREHRWRNGVRVALNFEARGSRGVSAMFDASRDNGSLVRAMRATAPRPFSSSLVTTVARALPNDTDGRVLAAHGFPVMNFAFIDGFENYHRATDTFEHLDARSVQHHGSYALPLARLLADADLASPPAPDLVYFDVLGRFLVAYPPIVGTAMSACALALFVFALVRARRQGLIAYTGVLRGFGFAWLAIAASAAASAALSFAIGGAMRPLLLIANVRATATAHVAVAALVCVMVLAWARRRRTTFELGFGALAIWIVGAACTAALAPGTGFVFHVPALFASVGLLVATVPSISPARRFAITCAATVPTVYLLAVVTLTLALMAGGAAATAPAVCVAFLVVLAWAPLSWAMPARALRRCVGGLAVASLALTVSTIAICLSDRATPRADEIEYTLDADTHEARWVSSNARPDSFTGAFLGAAPRHGLFPQLDAWPIDSLFATAPLLQLAPPEVSVVNDEQSGGRRLLTLRVRSARSARCVAIFEATGARVARTRVDGQEAFAIVHSSSQEMDRRVWHLVAGRPPRDVWNLDLCALPAAGFVVELDVDSGARLELHAVDRSDGLPSGVTIGTREPGLIPSQSSDVIRVAKRFDF